MKKVLWLFSVCLIMGMASCSSDDDNGSDGLVGHWESVSWTGVTTNMLTGEKNTVTKAHYSDISLWLYDDGTCQRNNSNGTYKHQGKELNVYVGTTYYNYIIKELSGKRMVLQESWREYKDAAEFQIDDEITMEKVN